MYPTAVRNGIPPDQFMRMTIREVQWRIEAIVQEQNRQLRLIAQLAAWVLTPFSSKPLKADDFFARQGHDLKAFLKD